MNATVFAAVVGCLSATLTSVLAGFLSHKKLRAELTADHRRELILRQILACEHLWSALRPISKYAGVSSVITQKNGTAEAQPKAIEEFCENVTSLFFSPTGLYLSREVRTALFEMRDFLMGCVDIISVDTLPIRLEKDRGKQFRRIRQELFDAIRAEIGAKNLRVGREGPLEHNSDAT